MLRRPYQLALVCALVFAIFYFTIYGDLCIVDDFSSIMSFFNTKNVTLRQIFLPCSAEGGYYRPLVMLSYLVNLRLWDMDGRLLHLDNVLMHVANASLVYLLTLSLLPTEKRDNSLAPLAAGLIFGFHPITTESVDWISGRTDLIAGIFVLVAALLVVRYRKTGSRALLAGAALSIMVGLLGKEVALGFIPGAFFLLVAREADVGRISAEARQPLLFRDILWFVVLVGGTIVIEVVFFNFWVTLITAPLFVIILYYGKRRRATDEVGLSNVTRYFIGVVATISSAIGVFFVIRHTVFTSNIPRIPQTIKLMGQDPNYTISVFLGSIGFYVKKFCMPIPLNFAIREIDPAFSLIGTFVLFIGIMFAVRRTIPTALGLTGVFLFAPALPLAFGTIAWTAYAERYIYISTAFWTIALVLWLAPHLQRFRRRSIILASTFLLLLMACVTIQRNFVWQSNLSLLRDTVTKSPRFREARTIYMGELIKAGDLREARKQYVIASSIPAIQYDERLDGAMAELLLKEGKEDESLRLYEHIFDKTHGNSADARRQIGLLLEAKIARVKDPELRQRLVQDLEKYRLTPEYNKHNSPHRIGL